jgi:hypothetical protein
MQNYGKFRKIKILKPIKSAYLAHVKSVYTDHVLTTKDESSTFIIQNY